MLLILFFIFLSFSSCKASNSGTAYNSGVVLYKQGKFKEAREQFKKSIENRTIKERSYFNWANSSYKNCLEILGEDWEKREIDPKTLESAKQEVADSITQYKEAAKIDEKNERTQNNLKRAEELLEKLEKKKQEQDKKEQDKKEQDKKEQDKKNEQQKQDEQKDNSEEQNKGEEPGEQEKNAQEAILSRLDEKGAKSSHQDFGVGPVAPKKGQKNW